MYDLRWYQKEAAEASIECLADVGRSPLVVVPTGGGKTAIIAEIIRILCEADPRYRILVPSHNKLIVEQDAKGIRYHHPSASLGIACAGLGSSVYNRRVTVGSIQTIYKQKHMLRDVHIIIVDEAHAVPSRTLARYFDLINYLRTEGSLRNVIGMTATPFRLDHGYLHEGKNAVFDSICYSCDVPRLISEGFLCKPVSVVSGEQFDEDDGDEEAGDNSNTYLTERAVQEMLKHGRDRKKWLVFCRNISHAEYTLHLMKDAGIPTDIIHSRRPEHEQNAALMSLRTGRIRAAVNVGCLTTGVDVPDIDLVAILRKSQSTSLVHQMIGRGMRIHPSKKDFAVLDFGGNIERHGAIDDPNVIIKPTIGKFSKKPVPVQAPRTKDCPQCNEEVPAGSRFCHNCGFKFPEREQKLSTLPILSRDVPATILHVPSIDGKGVKAAVIYNRGIASLRWADFKVIGLPEAVVDSVLRRCGQFDLVRALTLPWSERSIDVIAFREAVRTVSPQLLERIDDKLLDFYEAGAKGAKRGEAA
jgi:DNA repair protein RadD